MASQSQFGNKDLNKLSRTALPPEDFALGRIWAFGFFYVRRPVQEAPLNLSAGQRHSSGSLEVGPSLLSTCLQPDTLETGDAALPKSLF